MGGTRITDEERKEIVAMAKDGRPPTTIAEKLERSVNAVRKVINEEAANIRKEVAKAKRREAAPPPPATTSVEEEETVEEADWAIDLIHDLPFGAKLTVLKKVDSYGELYMSITSTPLRHDVAFSRDNPLL